MECPAKPSVVVSVLTIMLVHVMAAYALKLEPTGTERHVPPLLDCSSPARAPAASSDDLSAFRGNVLALLRALPAAAAAAPTGSVTASQSGGAVGDDDRAFARASCFGSVNGDCSRCLNESARVVPALREGRQLLLVHRNAVVVVAYSCYLRVPLFAAPTRWLLYALYALGMVVVLLIEIGGILFCIGIARNPDAW